MNYISTKPSKSVFRIVVIGLSIVCAVSALTVYAVAPKTPVSVPETRVPLGIDPNDPSNQQEAVTLSDLGETIDSFRSDITVNPDSTINVVETIVYDFGNVEKHGITRAISRQKGLMGDSTRFIFQMFPLLTKPVGRICFRTPILHWVV
jgi:hypothetical protein